MTHTLLISDVHLSPEHPEKTRLFLDFLATTARDARQLYVLGDLFDAWAGDDDLENLHSVAVISAFRRLADGGTAIGLMHGNRDFLLGSVFAERAGATLLEDPLAIELHGHRAVLSHGDALCTDDVAYQQFRAQVRSLQWQQRFLDQPLAVRLEQIAELRQRSEMEKSGKSAEIMDVNSDAVAALLRAQHAPEFLIHGHTHRPGCHEIRGDGQTCLRWVLGDWHAAAGNYLYCDAQGCRSVNIR